MVYALLRSHGPYSGAQYDLLKGMIEVHLRGNYGNFLFLVVAISAEFFGGSRRVAKSAMNLMVSWGLCAENLEAAVEFGKLINMKGRRLLLNLASPSFVILV
jgi:hypothetical protein